MSRIRPRPRARRQRPSRLAPCVYVGPAMTALPAAPWTWKHVWPVEDESTTRREAIAAATPELEQALADRALIPLSEPAWRLVEHDGQTWPDGVDLVLVATVPVVPARPEPDQWPTMLRWAADRGWTDRTLAGLIGLPEHTVRACRRRAGLPGHAARAGRAA